MTEPLLQIVLHEPEIPNNTGNIGRTCVATGCGLHLIRPLGFSTSVKALRRAGLDYWPRLSPKEHDTWEAYLAAERPGGLWLFTTKAQRTVYEADIRPGEHLVFGKETRGLPAELLERHADRAVSLPMLVEERSLNVATAVCAAVYVALGRMLAEGRARVDERGRLVAWGNRARSARGV